MKRKINGFFMAVAGLAIVSTLILLVFVFHELFGQQVMDDLRTYAFLLQDTCENEEKAQQTFQKSGIEDEELRLTIISADVFLAPAPQHTGPRRAEEQRRQRAHRGG